MSAHLSKEHGDFVRLQQKRRHLDEFILERFARGDVIHDRTGYAQALGEEVVRATGRFLAAARRSECDHVEVRARACGVREGSSRKMGEHGEGAGEREGAVGAVATADRPADQILDETRYEQQSFRNRTRIHEIDESIPRLSQVALY